MSESVSVGVVGCGYWGPNLIRNFSRLPNAKVQAVCDINEERLGHVAELYSQAQPYRDFHEMLLDTSLNAVVVATPLPTHYEFAKASLLAGKHTLVEKPLASSTAECDELVALAEERNLILMVGHTYLYSEPIHRIKEIVDSGDIGDILYINSQRLNLGLFQTDINVAWDLAPHDISIIMHILGEAPETVNCQGNAHITPDVEDVTNISLGFGGKRFASVQSSWLEPRKVRQMTIVGTRRMVIYDDLEPREKIRIYDVRVERPPHYDTFGQFHYSYHYGDCYIPHLQQGEPLNVLCRHFLECVEEGKTPLTCGREGAKLVRILEACSESLEVGGAPVSVSLENAMEPSSSEKKKASRLAGEVI